MHVSILSMQVIGHLICAGRCESISHLSCPRKRKYDCPVWIPDTVALLIAVFLCKPRSLQALPSANIEDKYLKGIKTDVLAFWQGVGLYI